MSADGFLQGVWYGKRSRLSFYLLPFSWLFRAVVAFRRIAFRIGAFRSVRVERPVIVVGNITVGGTGKTPAVLWLAEQLKSQGHRPGIISRGYRGSASAWPQDVMADSDPAEVGDEPVLLAERSAAIVVAGPDRVAAARRAIERGADVVLSDDGLQHYRLVRDCELVVVDAERGVGNGRLLPAGPLREPAGRLLQADALLLKSARLDAPIRKRGKGGPLEDGPVPRIPFTIVATTARSLVTAERRPLESFRGQPVHAVAGIGHPQAFFATLRAAGIIVMEHALPDHAAIEAADLAFDDELPVLMTEKDAVKCRSLADARLWAVVADAAIAPAQAALLLSLIESVMAIKA